MEIIKKKIYLEDHITRASGTTYGTVTATTFYFSIFLKQDMDDMGSFTNLVYVPKSNNTADQPNYTILTNKINSLNIQPLFPFMTGGLPTNIPNNINPFYRTPGKTAQDYYNFYNIYNNLFGGQITTFTENRVNDLQSYIRTNKFQLNLNIDNVQYVNYNNQTINGVSRIVDINIPYKYVFDANQSNPSDKQYGLYYENIADSNLAFVTYNSESLNITNAVLSAITKEEYLFGITSKPEIKSDVFIDRGITNVIEKQMRISEVKTVDQTERYQNNYFRVTRF